MGKSPDLGVIGPGISVFAAGVDIFGGATGMMLVPLAEGKLGIMFTSSSEGKLGMMLVSSADGKPGVGVLLDFATGMDGMFISGGAVGIILRVSVRFAGMVTAGLEHVGFKNLFFELFLPLKSVTAMMIFVSFFNGSL